MVDQNFTKTRLDRRDVEPHVPSSPSTVRVDHTNCTAGEDRRGRLYITLNSDGVTVKGFCHNCGLGTIFKKRVTIGNHRNTSVLKNTSAKDAFVYPKDDIEFDPSAWPAAMQTWIARYGITHDEVKRFGIGYMPANSTGVLTVRGLEDTVVGYQLRDFNGWLPAKYLTYKDKSKLGDDRLLFRREDFPDDKTLVVVEDILSCIKVGRIANSVACLGAVLSKQDLWNLCQKYDRIIVFLDNDNERVRKSQQQIKGYADLFCEHGGRIIRAPKDPKEHSMKELEELVYGKQEGL